MKSTGKRIIVVAGTRPELIKLAPLFWAFNKYGQDVSFIWSGQHYDYEMSKIFFKELNIPLPDFNLDIRSGSHAYQVARILIGIENILNKFDRRNGIVVAQGDTNTVLGAGLAAIKSKWLFAKVEAGLRSFNRDMPEEINRMVADTIANISFAPSINSAINLLYEGVMPWRIHITGNTIVDLIYKMLYKIEYMGDMLLTKLNINNDFGIVTIHRAENVDNPNRLKRLVIALRELSKEIKLVLPMHPRTRIRLSKFNLLQSLEGSNILISKPLGYLEFLGLMSRAKIVLTDSGGVQEEALTLAIPCITLRYNTERPETIWAGGNFLTGDNISFIINTTKYVIENRDRITKKIKSIKNPYGDGKAGERIVKILMETVSENNIYNKYMYVEPNYINVGYPIFVLISGEKFSNMTINEIQRKYPYIFITLIYDKDGTPIIPMADMEIKREWMLRLWGPKNYIKNLLSGS